MGVISCHGIKKRIGWINQTLNDCIVIVVEMVIQNNQTLFFMFQSNSGEFFSSRLW